MKRWAAMGLGVLALSAAALAAEVAPAWNFRNTRSVWNTERNLTVQTGPDHLKLDVTGYDSNLGTDRVKIDTDRFTRIRIVYQARGFKGKPTSGEIFFAGSSHPDFADIRSFRVPSLICDGQLHTLTLDAGRDIPAGAAQWSDERLVTKLRFDLVNEYPGEILLKSIEFLAPAPPVIRDRAEISGERGWYMPLDEARKNLALTIPAGTYYCWLYNAENPLAAQQAFAAVPGFHPESSPRHGEWALAGSLKTTAPTRVAVALSGVAGVLITPETSMPVRREIGGPARVESRVLAGGKPGKYLEQDPNEAYWKSKLVAARGHRYDVNYTLVRRRFNLKEKPADAWLQLSADDQIDDIFVNGVKIPGLWSQDWKYPSVVNVTKYLRRGVNLLAVKYTNIGGIGGLMYDLTVNDAAGGHVIIAGDGSEKCRYGQEPAAWFEENFNDAAWASAEIREGAPFEPYETVLLPYLDKRTPQGRYTVSASEFDPSGPSLKLTVKGEPALRDDEIIYAKVRPTHASKDSRPAAWASRPVGECQPVRHADGSVTLTLDGFSLPQYGGKLSGKVEFGVMRRAAAADSRRFVEFTIPARPLPDAERALVAKRLESASGSIITVNGKPFYPVFLDIFYERMATGLSGGDSPVNVRTFLAGGMSNEWWVGPDTYDFTEIDARIGRILREYPNAYIAAWVWCQPPHWYDKRYPERISKQNDGGVFPYYVSTVTFSDPEYRKDAGKAIAALVKHCETYFGSRMFAYNLSGGISLEWQGWGCHSQAQRKVLNDYSPAATRDFKAFAAARYPQLGVERVPTYEERTAVRETIFRDPVKDASSIAFDEYYSESIADCIVELARAAKQACGNNKLVGAYYGYYFEYGNMGFCINSSGHNAMMRLLKSPDIDFLLSPPSYGVRAVGEPGADMKVFGSIAAHGKFSMLEDDTRTHLTSPRDFYQTLNADQTRNVLRRNWGMALSRRTPLCLLTIDDGREFSADFIRADLGKVREAGQKLFSSERVSGVGIAVVVDEASLKYLRPLDQKVPSGELTRYWYGHHGKRLSAPISEQLLTGGLSYFQRLALGRVGAGVDWIYLDDVPALRDRYKFWVFLGEFAASPALEKALAALRETPSTVLVAYGAGFTGKQRSVDVAQMSKVLGMTFREVKPGSLKIVMDDVAAAPWGAEVGALVYGGDFEMNPRFAVADDRAAVLGRYADGAGDALAMKQTGAMKLVFSGGNHLTADLLRALARDAGVFINNADGDNFFAGYGVYTLHARTAGRKTIRFAQPVAIVRDVFTGEELGRNVSEVAFDLPAHGTRVIMTE